eukprot:CAMPEP_0172904356 /NCGR_PEP_ID=MMETSP1075-20121228/172453_1 /TAXON_ID=2916 /ORGANISM="Ceratium fusus, Strain PA161109" /LENGTH=57 /DNA_ID=CAMNT_0013761359 /DNA_START=513 /DNA_END=683 /DNA_ORIENTATION=+
MANENDRLPDNQRFFIQLSAVKRLLGYVSVSGWFGSEVPGPDVQGFRIQLSFEKRLL